MLDSNTVALNSYMASQDRADENWEMFEQDLIHDELVELVVDNYREEIIEQLMDDPAEDFRAEALLFLSEYALYSGDRKKKAWDSFLNSLQNCDFFGFFLEKQKEKMYEDWVDDYEY